MDNGRKESFKNPEARTVLWRLPHGSWVMEGVVGHQAEPQGKSFLVPLSFFLEVFSVFTGPVLDSSDY